MKLGFVSDIHENYSELCKAIKVFEKLNCDELVCLGDIVGFTIPLYSHFKFRKPNECIDLIRSNFKFSVVGNHDLFAIRKIPKNSFFEYPTNWYDLDFCRRKELSKNKIWLYEENELSALLNLNNQEYLTKTEEFIVVPSDEQNILISHFLFPDPTGSNKGVPINFEDHLSIQKNHDCNLSFVGHLHPTKMAFSKGSNIYQCDEEGISYERETKMTIFCPALVDTKNSGLVILNTLTKEVKQHKL